MKAMKALLAIMAVAMMVIVPLSAADIDAEKTAAVDGSTGYYVKNDSNITDLNNFTTVAGTEYVLAISSIPNVYYVSPNFLNFLTMNPKSVDMSVYEKDQYSSLKGMQYEEGTCYEMKGTTTVELRSFVEGYLFNDQDAMDGDLINKANEYFGKIPTSGRVTMTMTFSYKCLSKEVTNYAEAKDKFVAKSGEGYSYIESSSNATFTYGDKTVTVDCSYTMKMTSTLTYDCTVDVASDAPTTCKLTQKVTVENPNTVLKGKVNGTEYTNDLQKKVNADAEKTVKEQTKEAVDSPTECNTNINADADLTLSKVFSQSTEEAAQTYLKGLGFSGATDYSKAKSNFDAMYNSINASSEDNAWIWVLAIVFVALIAIVVIVIKK